MSINSAMLAGVSGLVANSDALSTISNNIANVNTVGYKSSDATFESLVTAQTQSGAPASGGVVEQTQQMVSTQGLTTQTSSPTDLSISGQGFFVTSSQPQSTSVANPVSFTRAGSFTQDSQGYLQNSAGLYLQGWPVNADGSVNTSSTNLSSLSSINVTALGSAPEMTTQVSLNANLNSDQTVSTAETAKTAGTAGAYNASTNSMSAYNATAGTGVKPDFSIQVPVSDSQGGQRTVQIDLLKTTQPNVWDAEIVAVPASDVVSGAGLAAGQIAVGQVAFTSTGALDTTNTTLFGGPPMPTNPTLNIGPSNAAAPAAGAVNWSSSLGIDGQSVALNLNTLSGGITQYDSASVTQSIVTNGTPFGNLVSVSVGNTGTVTALFDNGVSRNIAQVAIATFANPNGLAAISGNAYQATQNSGAFNLKAPGTGGAGLLASKTLEASTVDLSTEFASLITTQQAYSASSKIITTADQMLQVLINVIQ